MIKTPVLKPKSLTIQDFFERFPNDDACLEHLFDTRFGPDVICQRCGKRGLFRRLSKMPAYTCNCGNHIHPMAGTPFERSRTSLQKWFYAIFLFTTTRNGVAAKELQRQLGVTYKTAWRMAREIRRYMGWVDSDGRLGGPGNPVVEADKAFIGGKDKRGRDDKAIVLGMAERGGEVITRVLHNRSANQVVPHVIHNVRTGSRVATDEARAFRELPEHGYHHGTVNHAQGEYVRGEVHTNTIEAFWGNVKRAVQGTYVHVSPKWLQTYLWEFEFRHNLRKQPHLMFDLLLQAFPRPAL